MIDTNLKSTQIIGHVSLNNLNHNYKFVKHLTKCKHYAKKINYCFLIVRYNYKKLQFYKYINGRYMNGCIEGKVVKMIERKCKCTII